MTSCQFNATLNGVGHFIVASATAGHVAPENANVTDGKTYTYYAQVFDTSVPPVVLAWEAGSGAYVVSTHTQHRTTITANSNGDLLPVNFPTPPIVDVYASPSLTLEPVGLAAWTTFTPTITASSGSFTSVSAAGSFLQIGKMVSFICNITITTVGTAAGSVIMPLPVGTLNRNFASSGVDVVNSGKTLQCFGFATSSVLNIRNFDTLTAVVAGAVLCVSGTYEAA